MFVNYCPCYWSIHNHVYIDPRASAPGDFLPFTGLPVMFTSAPAEECVPVVIIDDDLLEQNEFFEVEIDIPQADGAVSIGPLNRTVVAIIDDGEYSTVDG